MKKNRAIELAIEKAGSQAALADKVGVSRVMISHWLHERCAVAAKKAIKLETATGIHRGRFRPDLWSQPTGAEND